MSNTDKATCAPRADRPARSKSASSQDDLLADRLHKRRQVRALAAGVVHEIGYSSQGLDAMSRSSNAVTLYHFDTCRRLHTDSL